MRLKVFIAALFLSLTGLSVNLGNGPDKDLFRVYPNPVIEDAVAIESEIDFHRIEILSIVGQIVHSEELEPSNSVRLRLSLHPGVYLIRISFTNNTNDTKRIWVN